jgi:hypothetical protein
MNYLPIEFGVVSGVGCGDGVALNGSGQSPVASCHSEIGTRMSRDMPSLQAENRHSRESLWPRIAGYPLTLNELNHKLLNDSSTLLLFATR